MSADIKEEFYLTTYNYSGFSPASAHFEPETETPAHIDHPTHAEAAGPSEKSAPEEGLPPNERLPGSSEERLGDVVSALGNGYEKPLPPPPAYNKPLPSLPAFTGASTEAPHMQIEGTQEFHDSVNSALKKLKTVPDGRKLLSGFKRPSGKGNTVTITEVNHGTPYARPRLSEAQKSKYGNPNAHEENKKANELAQKRGFGRKGQGASAEVGWSSTQALDLDSEGRPKIKDGVGTVDKPEEAHLALAHELIHARRIVKGTFTGGPGDRHDPSTPEGKEEDRAVGIGSRRNASRISENSIRRQFDQPLRTQYKGVPQPPENTRRTKPSSLPDPLD